MSERKKRTVKKLFVFKSVEDRNYFITTNLPATAQYNVATQPAMFKPQLTWYYLELLLPPEKTAEAPRAGQAAAFGNVPA